MKIARFKHKHVACFIGDTVSMMIEKILEGKQKIENQWLVFAPTIIPQMEPRNSRNAVWLLQKREIYSSYGRLVRKNCQFTDRLIKRLGLEGELEGHKGCVNCLQWNSDAR